MNKKLPFEEAFEQQMNNLPSPNEDESWQKMKRLLNDKEDRKPFAFFRSYKVGGALMLLLLIGLWLVIRPSKSSNEKGVSAIHNNDTLKQKASAPALSGTENNAQPLKPTTNKTVPEPVNNQGTNQGTKSTPAPATGSNIIAQEKIKVNKHKLRNAFVAKASYKTNTSIKNNPSVRENTNKQLPAGKQTAVTKTNDANNVLKEDSSNDVVRGLPGVQQNNEAIDSTISIQPGESVKSGIKDSVTKNNIASNDSGLIKNIATTKPKNYIFSAGITMQHQIPVAGQHVVRYARNGISSTLIDYIPSVYFSFQKKRRWFLQGGFSYASPQLVKEFAYSRQTRADLTSSITTTTLRLKKTFYSEIPLSFNYYIRPNWSAGVGGMYSWFHGAVAEKETVVKNAQTQIQSVAKEIVPIKGFTDSFLYRSHTYLLFQTDYHWQRLSMGLRYTRDMQPYIKYTLPDGTITDQKNWSLEFILRWRLWKSAKF